MDNFAVSKPQLELIKRSVLEPGDKLVVKVDITGLPHRKAVDYMESVAEEFKKVVPDFVKVIMVPKNIELEIISGENNGE